MKATLRLPTKDQYAYIELETEVMSADDAVVAYNDAMRLLKPSEGLPAKEFNAFLDKYLTENTGDLETYNRMNQQQKDVIQEIKKSFKRLKTKE